jgi:hypothetical protein
MRAESAARVAKRTPFVAPFRNGDRMDQKTFHALYKQSPPGFMAELIGGIVYMPSPTTFRHGRPHGRVVMWLGNYADGTPGTDFADNTTNILDDASEPQPDAILIVGPEYGGQTGLDEEGYVIGPAELVAEVAYSSANIDLHAKRLDYESAGVREYVVVLVEPRRVVWFGRRGTRFVERKAEEDGIFRSAVFPGLWLDPVALFAPTTRRLNAVLRQGLATPEHAAFVTKLEAKRAALARRKPKTDA